MNKLDTPFKIICTLTFIISIIIGQVYCVDTGEFNRLLTKWKEDQNGQYDHPEDSTSGRTLLVYKMGQTMDSKFVPLLEKILIADHYACVRAEAAKSLERIGDSSAIPTLKKSLNADGNVEVSLDVARTLLTLSEFSNDVYDKIYSIARCQNRDKWSYKGFYNKQEEVTDTSLSNKFKNHLQFEAIKCLEMISNGEALKILEEQETSSNVIIAEIAKNTKSKWLAKYNSGIK